MELSVKERAILLDQQSNHIPGPSFSLSPRRPLVPRSRAISTPHFDDGKIKQDPFRLEPHKNPTELKEREIPPPMPPQYNRSLSTNGRLQNSKAKSPPPVPSKPNTIQQKLDKLQLGKTPRGPLPGIIRTKGINSARLDRHEETLIIIESNDEEPGGDNLISEHPQLDEETPSPPQDEPRNALIQVTQQVSDFSKGFVNNAGGIINPLATKARGGLLDMGVGAKKLLDKTKIPTVFMATHNDLADITSKMNGAEGLCKKCQTLPVHLYLSNPSKQKIESLGSEAQWATPLSRILYHADWCRVCRLLLDMLCLPTNDPLQHSTVSPHLQPELAGWTMRDWVSKGWKFNDEQWPFGHGDKRYEGATYVLGPGSEAVAAVLKRTLALLADYGVLTGNGVQSRPRRTTNFRHRQQLREARNPPQYPLSCVLRISIDTQCSSTQMLNVHLMGYGRKLGSELQCLSSFRLRVVSTEVSKLLHSEPEFGCLSYGRLLDPIWIDPSIGALWLRECELRHGSECSEHGWAIAMQKPGFLRAIDVEVFCIKEILDPARCRYVALSYVWGGSSTVKLTQGNMLDLMSEGGLRRYMHKLPQTVVDAIEVVRRLGERYLWTDALCILQDSPQEAAEQISCMDRVYGSALLTIVAAQGNNANAGLKGIRNPNTPEVAQRPEQQRQVHQSAARVKEDAAFVAPLMTTNYELDRSPWNSRAWTFQERILSRRLIIFTKGQMIWQCRRMACREDMTVADSGVPYTPLQWLSLKPRYMGVGTGRTWVDGSIERTRHSATRLVRSATFAEYAKTIEQYTHRHMSYQEDILNAFAGISHIFSLAFKCGMRFGLPEALLDTSLLWRPTEQLKRRRGFPSWSWSGWVGRVAYDEPFKITQGADGGFVSFAWDACGEEGIRPLIRWHVWDPFSRRVQPLNKSGLGFPFEGADLPEEWENGPYCFDVNGNGAPRIAPAVSMDKLPPAMEAVGQCLIFWASTCNSLHLGKEITQPSDRRWNAQKPPRRYYILDAHSENVGTLLLDGDDDDWRQRGRHEFIQIAEAQYFGLDNEARDIEEPPLYLVMLVEWGKEKSVAQRVGLGRVQKTAWMLAAPKPKLVCLG